VFFAGEIVPQSLCTRYGLAVGYFASPLVRVLMILAWPVAWPLGKLLDYIVGHGEGGLPRCQLQHFVALHDEEEGFVSVGEGLSKNELNVIQAALELTYKTAKEAMTPLDKVFMLSDEDVMNEELVAKILCMGHSRVPVYAGQDRKNIIGLLLVKELLLRVTVRPCYSTTVPALLCPDSCP
jgi:metal transporter CNNM